MSIIKQILGKRSEPKPVPPELQGLKRLYQRFVTLLPAKERDIYSLTLKQRELLGDVLDAIGMECEALGRQSDAYSVKPLITEAESLAHQIRIGRGTVHQQILRLRKALDQLVPLEG